MNRVPPQLWARPFAHRGLHGPGVPENSLAAVSAAVEAGYGVEFDVQFAADGTPMVFHDYTLDRLTAETGRVDAREARELGRVALLSTGETIPTLVESLDTVAGRVPVLLEIKDPHGAFGETDGALEARVCEAVSASGNTGMTAIMSFNPHSIGHVRDCLPEALRGLVSYDFEHEHDAHVDADRRRALAALQDFDRLGCDFVSYGATSLPTPKTEALRARGVPVFCWTVRSEAQAQAALRHCDQITFEGFRPA